MPLRRRYYGDTRMAAARIRAYPPAVVQTRLAPAPRPALMQSLGGETILLVEDEELVRTVIRLSLTNRGYRVLEAPTSAHASRLWYENAGSIDLLISDLGLGGDLPSGLELAERFKGLSRQLKVLIMTGRSIAELEARFPCHFLQKPFDLSQLEATVRRVLDEVLEERSGRVLGCENGPR